MAETLHYTDARRVADTAVAEGLRRDVQIAIAVVDDRGDLVYAARLDGARSYYPDVAYGKAIASALWKQPSRGIPREPGTSSIQVRVNSMYGGRVVFAGGAVPLVRDGVVLGAVGVGGSGPESDEEIAKLAAEAF